jgi:hypothetical protein
MDWYAAKNACTLSAAFRPVEQKNSIHMIKNNVINKLLKIIKKILKQFKVKRKNLLQKPKQLKRVNSKF